ncbi:MAG TPA: ABC transporter permease [Candidatus Dormibacteraeota bacterium]|nr:ABC transporter permease [Candidatus Dormibacteraeota bacterium]
MLEVFRNLARRKVRSALTVSGIVIGIFAFTTMGALAEHFNSLLDLGVRYAGSAVAVGAPAGEQTSLLPLAKAKEIARVPGVAAVYPTYTIQADPGGGDIQMGPPELITAEQPGASAYGAPRLPLAGGRDLAAGSRGEVVLGSAMATQLGKRPGDAVFLPIRPRGASSDFASFRFTVVGVLAKTGNAVDDAAYVSASDARMVLRSTLPEPLRAAVDVNTVAQGFAVYGQKGSTLGQLDAIAARINRQVPGVQAQRPSQMVASFKSTGTTFTAVTTGAALLALIIGGLSVANTMIMAVGERVREIGLKKALGAHTGQVMREFVLEAMVIGAIGGVVGYLLGLGLTTLVDDLGGSQPLDVFLVTPRLTAVVLGFAVAMAGAAGVVPALRAARLDPVAALHNR